MIEIDLPIKTVSEGNMREHWGKKSQRAKQQRHLAYAMTMSELAKINPHELVHPIVIKFVRYGKRKLDDDNLIRSFKSIRDGVCDALEIDDGSECLRFVYGQAKGEYAVNVCVC